MAWKRRVQAVRRSRLDSGRPRAGKVESSLFPEFGQLASMILVSPAKHWRQANRQRSGHVPEQAKHIVEQDKAGWYNVRAAEVYDSLPDQALQPRR